MRPAPTTFLFVCCMLFAATLCCLTLGIIGVTAKPQSDWFNFSFAALIAFILLCGWVFVLVSGPNTSIYQTEITDSTPPYLVSDSRHSENNNALSFANYQKLKQLLAAHKEKYQDAIYHVNTFESTTETDNTQ